jgi:hypothetical protein
MLLSKTQLIESKESENRGLSRRLEKMNETQRANQLDWTKVNLQIYLCENNHVNVFVRSAKDCKEKRINLNWRRRK